MTPATATTPSLITPTELAGRLGRGEAITVLDVREGGPAAVEAETALGVRVPAAVALADPATLAARLAGPVAVVCNRGQIAQPVARALRAHGVDAAVLEGGVRGWIAALREFPVELGLDGLEVRQVQRPGRGCMSYVLAAGGRAVVVDPAPDPGFYIELARDLGARVTDVVDTHLHADHLSGARELAERAGAALRMPAASLDRGVAYADAVEPLADGDRLDLAGVELRALALPGHTTDMTGLLVADRALISGDSVFADGLARPDLERGDPAGARAMARLLHATLAERVLGLGDRIVVLPGHDHPVVRASALAPTLGEVRAAVPELSIADPDAFAEELVAELPPRPANYESVIAVNAGRRPSDPDLESGANSCATR
ncbi:MAG TPA: MBL fold metallo-hydrolase [Solirubrobacterales bacterium]|nr:MBL fold metallo-hydrolase [Solirubrobacterales bacterium]